MPTDQRLTQRKAVSLSVTVYQDGHPIICTNSLDVSRNGISLDAGPSFDLNTLLEVELSFDQRIGSKRLRIPAMVAHSSTEGTGLNLVFTDKESRHALEELIRDAV